MNLCACGCGKEVKNKWVRGHQYRMGRGNAPLPGQEPVPLPGPQADGPPPYPQSIDRRRWRLASERPGTSPLQPWIETKCHECVSKMWTRDPTSTWEFGGVCEECEYRLRSGMNEQQGRQYNLQARTIHDPFRPR